MSAIISDPEVDIVTLSYPLYMTISAFIGKLAPIQLRFLGKNVHKNESKMFLEGTQRKIMQEEKTLLCTPKLLK